MGHGDSRGRKPESGANRELTTGGKIDRLLSDFAC